MVQSYRGEVHNIHSHSNELHRFNLRRSGWFLRIGISLLRLPSAWDAWLVMVGRWDMTVGTEKILQTAPRIQGTRPEHLNIP
jgi:hypothetical protein